MRDKRNLFIFALLIIMVGLSFSFISYSTRIIELSDSSEIKKWDVGITNVEVIENGTAKSGEIKYSEGTLVINPTLYDSNDYVEYKVTISNKGLLNAKLSRIAYNEKNPNSPLIYEYEDNKFDLHRREEKTITIKAKIDPTKYNEGERVQNELTALFEYIQE